MITPPMPSPPPVSTRAPAASGKFARASRRTSSLRERLRPHRPSTATIATIGIAAAVAALAPLGSLDQRARSWALGVTAPAKPSRGVIVVEITPAELRRGACDVALPDALRRGRATGALLPPALDALCDVQSGSGVARLPATALHQDSEGAILGFDMDAVELEGARSLGLSSARWVARRARGSVPVVELAAIGAGRVPPSVLADRVVIACLAVRGAGDPFELRVADAVAGALDGAVRKETPWWTAPPLPIAALIGAFAVQKHWGGMRAVLVLLGALILAVALHLVLALTGLGLWPLASVLAATGVGFAGLLVVAARNWQRTVAGTTDLLRSVSLKPPPPSEDEEEDSSRWAMVRALAADAFPADRVLVAEHDDAAHVLRFHGLPDEADLIAEPERDPRRPPYRDEGGLVVVQIVRGFLRGDDRPALLVPMTAHGDLQGYVVLTGTTAVEAHLEDPFRAQILGEELGLLLHPASLIDGASPSLRRSEPNKLAHLMSRARALAEQARFLSALTAALPVGAAWADETGRVRIINKRFAAALASTGLSFPPEVLRGILPSDALSLSGLIGQLAGSEKMDLVRAMRGQGWTTTISIGEPSVALRLTVRAERRRGAGASAIAGYVLVLAPEGDPWFADNSSTPPPVRGEIPSSMRGLKEPAPANDRISSIAPTQRTPAFSAAAPVRDAVVLEAARERSVGSGAPAPRDEPRPPAAAKRRSKRSKTKL